MIWKEEIIRLSSIDIEDHTFRITTDEKIESLSISIKNAGLINPPIIIGKKSKYSVVSGFRRIRSAEKLGWKEFPARVLDPETGRFECAKLAVTDNLLQRPLNLIETSRCYRLLSEFLGKEELLREASVMGLSENPGLIEKTMRLSGLPPFIQNCVISETISLGMALQLGELDFETGIAFAQIFDKLKPSLNKQREIFSLSCEIALRENIPVLILMKEDNFRNIISDENSDRNKKIRELRHFLKKRRFPNILTAEQGFEKKVKKLGLTEGIKLIPPAGFEGNTFILSMEFKKASEFDEQVECLKRVIDNPLLAEILSKEFSD
jgi:ParB family transcriptional regulator, chromosome partitioning protein